MIISTSDIVTPSQPQPKAKKRIMRSRSQWKTLLEEFNSSGLSKVAFCKQHGIAISSLNRWQKMLEEKTGGADFIDVTEPLSIAPAGPSLTPECDNLWQVELALGNDIVLRLRTG
jgi:hypothetical protein